MPTLLRLQYLRWLWLAIPAAVLLSSCEVPFDPDLQTLAPTVVVEGVVTDEDTTQYVRLTQTQGYGNNAAPIPISGAIVTITDNEGNAYILAEATPGRYETEALTGVTGRIYTLRVTAGGNSYTATDTLRRQHLVDSLTYRFYEEASFIDTAGYYLTTYSRDPDGRGDYIMYRFYKNGVANANTLANIRVFSDRFIQEDFPIVAEWSGIFRYELGDSFKVDFLSVSELSFNYYRDLQSQDGSGSPFAGPAYNPRTNVTGGASGFFRCSGVRRLQGVIEE
jgi:hypothetical protein